MGVFFMSGIRCLYTEFWKDDFLLELSPEDKYFYIYLLTNDRCSNCGIYSFNAKFAAVELGYSVETVKTLINRFVKHEKVLYSEKNGEIMILNWFKYNVNINNRNARVCINTCLKKIKTLSFIKKLYLSCIKDNPNNQSFIDEMFKDIDISAIEDEPQDELEQQSNIEISDENEVQSEENIVNQEEERKNNSEKLNEVSCGGQAREIVRVDNDASFQIIMNALKENLFKINDKWDQLLELRNFDITPDVIMKSVEIAVMKNNKSIGYVNGILNNWYKAGVKDMESYKAIIESNLKRYP